MVLRILFVALGQKSLCTTNDHRLVQWQFCVTVNSAQQATLWAVAADQAALSVSNVACTRLDPQDQRKTGTDAVGRPVTHASRQGQSGGRGTGVGRTGTAQSCRRWILVCRPRLREEEIVRGWNCLLRSIPHLSCIHVDRPHSVFTSVNLKLSIYTAFVGNWSGPSCCLSIPTVKT